MQNNKAGDSCRVCGRQLKNPESRDRGVGPVCGGGFKKSIRKRKDKETLDMFNAEFEYRFRDKVLVIYDLNRGARSVTNDMENVLKNISKENPGREIDSRTLIVYQDSMGRFDGVKWLKSQDRAEFIALQVLTEKEAIAKIIQHAKDIKKAYRANETREKERQRARQKS